MTSINHSRNGAVVTCPEGYSEIPPRLRVAGNNRKPIKTPHEIKELGLSKNAIYHLKTVIYVKMNQDFTLKNLMKLELKKVGKLIRKRDIDILLAFGCQR